MTIQIAAPLKHGASKQALQDALNNPEYNTVNFMEPSPFGNRIFSAGTINKGTSFPVVMDPDTRRRFAKVVRRADGTFKVE